MMSVSNQDGIARLEQQIARQEQKLALIREQRDVLANAQSVLNSLFDGSDDENPDGSVSSGESVASTAAAAATAAGKRAKPPRRAEVVAYLEEHGPTKRARLIEATGIPEGTISYLLNDKRQFRRLEDGTWDIKPDDDAGLPLDQSGSPAQDDA